MLARIFRGYAGAVASSGFVLILLRETLAPRATSIWGAASDFVFITFVIAAVGLLPFSIVCWASERWRIRTAAFYAVASTLIALALSTLFFQLMIPYRSAGPVQIEHRTLFVLIVYTASGLVGGLMYWALAGRHAGAPS
jgi:hypothetical protein